MRQIILIQFKKDDVQITIDYYLLNLFTNKYHSAVGRIIFILNIWV